MTASLQLTPLIDVFVVVLFFLMLRFEASGQVCCIPPPLPVAELGDSLVRAPIIGVFSGVVALDGTEVARVSDLLDDDSPDWKIAELTERLEVNKHTWVVTHPHRAFSGTVIISADRTTDVKVLKKVLYSCGLAGYPGAHLAVKLRRRH